MINGARLCGAVFLAVYIIGVLLSPALRISGVQGMRGITADHLFLVCFLVFVWLFSKNGIASAVHIALRDRGAPGRWYLGIVLIALLSAIFRILADEGMFSPMIEVARLYGLVRPLFVILFAAVLYQIYSLGQSHQYLNDLGWIVIGVGGIAVLIGVLQGVGVPWAVEVTSTLYTRDLNFEEVLIYGRAYGTFDGQPNVFGTFCGLFFLFVLFRLGNVAYGVLFTPLLILAALGLLLSGSRGALLALVLAVATWSMLRGSFQTFIAIAFVSLAVAAVLTLSIDFVSAAIINRLASALGLGGGGDVSLIATRIPYWGQILDLVVAEPMRLVWGVPGKIMPPADNLQLGLLGGLGFLGALFYMVVLLVQGVRFYVYGGVVGVNMVAITIYLVLNGISYPTFLNARIGDLFWLAAALASLKIFDNMRGVCESSK